MNKQALAFLTLFSLILMLSVYYVTLPMDTASVMGENTNAEESQADNPSQRTSLQEEAGKKKDDEITKTAIPYHLRMPAMRTSKRLLKPSMN